MLASVLFKRDFALLVRLESILHLCFLSFTFFSAFGFFNDPIVI